MTKLRNKVKSLEIRSPLNAIENAAVENEELSTLTGRAKNNLKAALSIWVI